MKTIDEAEERIIGLFLDRPDCISATALRPEHFHHPHTRKIAEVIYNMDAAGSQIEPIGVAIELEKSGVTAIGTVEIADYLIKQSSSPTNIDTLQHWADQVIDRYEKRRVLNVAESITQQLKRGVGVAEVIESVNRDLSSVQVGKAPEATLREELGSELHSIARDQEAIANGEDICIGLPVGLGLDSIVAGGTPLGVVSILCGDTGTGKSTVVQNMLDEVTSRGDKAMVFSVEDSIELYRQRALARISGVPLQNILRRECSKNDMARMARGADEVRDATKLVILDDTAGLTAPEIVSKYRRAARSDSGRGIRLLVLDYLQLLGGHPDEKVRLREAMITLVNCAKKDNIAVIAVSQLNREGLKNRKDPVPRKQDLYGSGTIEQYSKLILGVYRPSKFIKEPQEGRHYFEGEERPTKEEWKDRLELWVLKNIRGEDNVFTRLEWTRSTGKIVTHEPRIIDAAR